MARVKPTRHGLSHTPEYNAWKCMNTRCLYADARNRVRYTDRNIAVCPEWSYGTPGAFLNFLEHVGEKPGPEYELDRIDNDQGYFPGNVRWATKSTNLRNVQGQGSSKYVGVYWNKAAQKWQAYITVNGTCRYLGIFTSEQDAVLARKKAELQLEEEE